jgi:hypothetical protein
MSGQEFSPVLFSRHVCIGAVSQVEFMRLTWALGCLLQEGPKLVSQLDSIFALHNRIFDLARDYKSQQKKGEVRRLLHEARIRVMVVLVFLIQEYMQAHVFEGFGSAAQ